VLQDYAVVECLDCRLNPVTKYLTKAKYPLLKNEDGSTNAHNASILTKDMIEKIAGSG
jgi:hypothetical protein